MLLVLLLYFTRKGNWIKSCFTLLRTLFVPRPTPRFSLLGVEFSKNDLQRGHGTQLEVRRQTGGRYKDLVNMLLGLLWAHVLRVPIDLYSVQYCTREFLLSSNVIVIPFADYLRLTLRASSIVRNRRWWAAEIEGNKAHKSSSTFEPLLCCLSNRVSHSSIVYCLSAFRFCLVQWRRVRLSPFTPRLPLRPRLERNK